MGFIIKFDAIQNSIAFGLKLLEMGKKEKEKKGKRKGNKGRRNSNQIKTHKAHFQAISGFIQNLVAFNLV